MKFKVVDPSTIEIINNYLLGSSLSEYQYNHGGFKVSFSNSNLYTNKKLEFTEYIFISIDNFWFNTYDEWSRKINSIPLGKEPEDEVRAMFLTRQMWEEGSVVSQIEYDNISNVLTLKFENSISLNINLSNNDEYEEYTFLMGSGKNTIVEIGNNNIYINTNIISLTKK